MNGGWAEELIVVGRNNGFKQGRVSPGCLARACGPAGLSETVPRSLRGERAKLKSRRDDMIIAPGKRSAARGYGRKMISSFFLLVWRASGRAKPEEKRRLGDGAKEMDFALGTRFGDGDGDGVFMDIEADIECNRLHGVVVSSHSHDESERIPRPRRGRSCGSAHPGNPRNNERQPHRLFQPRSYRRGARRQP